jgi:hypothetical protein
LIPKENSFFNRINRIFRIFLTQSRRERREVQKLIQHKVHLSSPIVSHWEPKLFQVKLVEINILLTEPLPQERDLNSFR